jgi:hypothetical protein
MNQNTLVGKHSAAKRLTASRSLIGPEYTLVQVSLQTILKQAFYASPSQSSRQLVQSPHSSGCLLVTSNLVHVIRDLDALLAVYDAKFDDHVQCLALDV